MSKVEKKISVLLFLLLVVVLFVNLGNQPLYMEEPRRALIALEMILSDNYIVPIQFGSIYTSKPPLFNWVLIALFKTFNTSDEWLVRIPTVLSLLGMFLLLYVVAKKYVNQYFAVLSAFFFAIGADILMVFSLLGEIDLFYSLITLLSLLSIFHFYQQARFWYLFIFSYTFAALGFLTKGIPSIAYLIISLIAYFIYQKNIRKLFSVQHLIGLSLFLTIVGTYFYLYHLQADAFTYLYDLTMEARDKSTAGSFPFFAYLKHILLFPVQTLGGIFPTSILLLFLFKTKVKASLKANPLLAFSAIIVLSNFFLYWLSPGSRQRYIYPLYPFMNFFFVYFFLENKQPRKIKFFHRSIVIMLCVMFFLSVSLPLIQSYEPSRELMYIQNIAYYALGFGIGFLILLYLYSKKQKVFVLIASMLFFRLLIDIVIIPSRNSLHNKAQDEKLSAQKIAKLTKGEEVSLCWAWVSQRTAFYYTQASGKILSHIEEKDYVKRQAGYYIIWSGAPQQLFEKQHKSCLEFKSNNGIATQLIKLSPQEDN